MDKEKAEAAAKECVRSFYEEFKATMKYAEATFYLATATAVEEIAITMSFDFDTVPDKPKKTVKPKRTIKRLSQANFIRQLEKVIG